MKTIPEDFSPARILVIQLRQIGDALMTTPALRALRKRYPEARVSYLAEPLPSKVLWGNPNIDELIIRDPKAGGLEPVRTVALARSGRFDLVIDFLANPRTSVIALLSGARYTLSYAGNRRSFLYTHAVRPEGIFSADRKTSILRVLGAEPEPADLDMAVPGDALDKIDAWLDQAGLALGGGPLACVEPFQKWPALTWTAEGFAKLADLMSEEWGARVVVCWGPGKEEDARKIADAARDAVLAPATDLHELAALYRRADLWTGVDCGPRHIAASQGAPTFGVLGPSDDAWTPPGPRHVSVFKDGLECVPCNKRRCPLEHHRCMLDLSAEEVFDKLRRFVSRPEVGILEGDGHAR